MVKNGYNVKPEISLICLCKTCCFISDSYFIFNCCFISTSL